jgi:succinyldiaminopimelate transaminase
VNGSASRTLSDNSLTDRLPQFPWDRIEPLRRLAARYSGGIIDLSKGNPVDPVPMFVRDALAAAANAPGYPATYGTSALRTAAANWLRRRHGVTIDPKQVLPTAGSKELLTLLPTLLNLGTGDAVAYPRLAYPSYDVGARLAGARSVVIDDVADLDPRLPTGERLRLVWVNSPANPTGRVLTSEKLRETVQWARTHGVVVASDECYLEFGWDEHPVSLLHPDVAAGSHRGLLAVHSLSKRSNLAGYRAGFVAGDAHLIDELLLARKHLGLITSTPVQHAMVAALRDDEHVVVQRERYVDRRARLRAAFESAGWTIEHSTAGLFLWARHRSDAAWRAAEHLAAAGILVAPGELYGSDGRQHVRVAITALPAQIDGAVTRLGMLGSS